jgi:hypothetical protein
MKHLRHIMHGFLDGLALDACGRRHFNRIWSWVWGLIYAGRAPDHRGN